MSHLSDKQIEQAKVTTRYAVPGDVHHEHPDCIRIAYEWLDAQATTKTANRRNTLALKHIIENWAGRYVSQSDVEVAANLHPQIFGTYPNYNISSRLVRPSADRLGKIPEAKTQGYGERYDEVYAADENA